MKKICIVDDEKAVLKGLSNSLDWDTYGIAVAGLFTDPCRALESMKTESYDILLTDVCMEGMTGLELIEKAKEENRDIAVIVISAWDSFSYVKKALKLGAANYLLKPLDTDELEETIQMILENRNEIIHNNSGQSVNMAAFRNSILERWQKNKIDEYELRERAEILSIDLNCRYYTSCLIHVSGPGEELDDSSFVLESIKENLDSSLRGYFYLISTDTLAGVVLDQADDTSILECYFKTLAVRLGNRDIKIFCTIGARVNDFMALHISYGNAELLQALDMMKTPVLLFDCKYDLSQDNRTGVDMEQMKKAFLIGSITDAKERFSALLDRTEQMMEGLTRERAIYLSAFLLRAIEDNLSTDFLPDNINQYMVSLQNPTSLRNKLERLFDACTGLITSRKNDIHPYVKKTIQWIYQEFNQNVSLKTAAYKLNVNPAYLGQLFHGQTGKYFNAFLSDVRLERARTLIINSNLSVSEISVKAGFSSASYFNRIFKKKYSVPPSEYRQKKRAGFDYRPL